MLSLISILPFDQKMENRAEKLRSGLFVSGISWKLDTIRILSNFWVILRSSSSLLCFLFPKVSKNPDPELQTLTTHLISGYFEWA